MARSLQTQDRHVGSQAVRVSRIAYEALKEMADESGVPVVRCLDALVLEAHRQRFWSRVAEANRRAEGDPVHLDEQATWSQTDADGLDSDDGVPLDEAPEDAATW